MTTENGKQVPRIEVMTRQDKINWLIGCGNRKLILSRAPKFRVLANDKMFVYFQSKEDAQAYLQDWIG